ncbi:MAG TPA: hypothetical protein PKY59_26390 [Pyrinomonadaceae bacterium]|nr:hypothetical protein [Pyrinomonadaceae bacterium]
MKKTIYILAIIIFGTLTFACGGKAEKSENEKKQNPVASNQTANSAANQKVLPTRNDGDADDFRATNSNIPAANNANSSMKTDADDLRKSNSSQKSIDRDDRRGKGDADDRNRNNNSRRDADDYGKRDNDGDADDN